jgi:hypothetical protein
MNISMEQIDEMRKRTNCSYHEAKVLLEKHNGDLVEAIIEFEKKHSSKSNKENGKSHSFGQKVKDLIHKGFVTRFVIEKDENTILNISVNILILAVILTMPVFWIYPVLFIVLYLVGYKFRLRREGEEVNINEIVDEFGDKVKGTVSKKSDGVKGGQSDSGQENSSPGGEEGKDGYNEITIDK